MGGRQGTPDWAAGPDAHTGNEGGSSRPQAGAAAGEELAEARVLRPLCRPPCRPLARQADRSPSGGAHGRKPPGQGAPRRAASGGRGRSAGPDQPGLGGHGGGSGWRRAQDASSKGRADGPSRSRGSGRPHGRGVRGARPARWGWFQAQRGEFPKQMLTHDGAEPAAHTSGGTAMSPQTRSHQPP